MANSVGRPRVYGDTVRARIAKAVKRFGLTGALNHLRSLKATSGISMVTVINVADEYGIERKMGRRTKKAQRPKVAA